MPKMEIETWPALPLAEWQETCRTLHMWTQMVGKVRLALAPKTNHWWHVTLYLSARGFTTGPMPMRASSGPARDRNLEIAFDFLDHALRLERDDGARREIPLEPQSVAHFYERFTAELARIGAVVPIWPVPCEVTDPVRFPLDTRGAYDAEPARRFWHILSQVDRVMKSFRGRYIGKCSPVHFFWGSFDLAVTRFSGRPAPPIEGADAMTREGYSHECCSAGFWPGSDKILEPAFYSYVSPQPEAFPRASIGPAGAFYDTGLGMFLYRYDDMRSAPDPDAALLEFLQSTYAAAATLGAWDRTALERAS